MHVEKYCLNSLAPVKFLDLHGEKNKQLLKWSFQLLSQKQIGD